MSFLVAGVEGWVDKAVLEKIFAVLGISCDRIQDYGGCAKLDAEIPKFLAMTHTHAVCVLRDQDSAECAPSLLRRLGWDKAKRQENLVFRIAEPQVEAWLLADSEAFARHFKVPKALISAHPDTLPDAKEEVLKLVRRSKSPAMKEGMLPREGYAGRTGAEYASLLNDYTRRVWDPERARVKSPSLDRCLRAFQGFSPKPDT